MENSNIKALLEKIDGRIYFIYNGIKVECEKLSMTYNSLDVIRRDEKEWMYSSLGKVDDCLPSVNLELNDIFSKIIKIMIETSEDTTMKGNSNEV